MLIFVPKKGIYETTKVRLVKIEDSGKTAMHLTSGVVSVTLVICSENEANELLGTIASRVAKVKMQQRGLVIFDPDEELRKMRGRRD